MPGIVGLITRKSPQQAGEELDRMLEAIRHESFYTTGTWSDESLGVYVGWVARRGSFSAEMPLQNEKKDISLVFSGEEYPEPDTFRSLKERGHLVSSGRPSYLVHLYEQEPSFPACLNGRFQGLVVDRRREMATLFTDRYGLNRIYFHESADTFYLAPEAKAILAVCPELRTIDPEAMGEFVSYGCILEDRSFFRGIRALPSAAAWTFRNGSIDDRTQYFTPRQWEDQEALEPESYYRELRHVFSTNVARYFGGRERVGMALTGGLDTRSILSWRNGAPGTLPCYTFGGIYRDCQDVRIARRVADLCRQPHHVITVGKDFLSNFGDHAERATYLTEGSADISKTHDLYVSRKAREIAPAKVVGTWGSEILRGTTTSKPTQHVDGLFNGSFAPYVNGAENTYLQASRVHPVTFAAFLQARWHHHGVFGLEGSQLSVHCPFLDNDFIRAVYRAPATNRAGDVRLRLIADGNPELARLRSDRGVGGASGRLVENASRFWQELTFKAEYAYDYGMPHWAARTDHLLSPLRLDRVFLGRHKFSHFRVWYRDALSGYVKGLLLDPQALGRPYLERKALQTVVDSHLNGQRNYTTTIHRLITLELLHRLFV